MDNIEGKKNEAQSQPADIQPQQTASEKNPFMKTVADLIRRGRNRRTFARPR